MSPNRRIFLNIVATYGRSVYRYWRGCGNLLRKKSGAVAQGRMVCCATKVVPLRKADVECNLTSSRKRSAHLFVEKCAPFRKEERT